MRSFASTLVVCLAMALVDSQFNDGAGNFFTFNSEPSSQAAPAIRPPQQQPAFRPQQQAAPFRPQQPIRQAAPAPAARPAAGAGGCTPSNNYQSGNRNFWVSWRSKIYSSNFKTKLVYTSFLSAVR